MKTQQISMFDLGLFDCFDCDQCTWKKTYGTCYPKEKLNRQYFYANKKGRMCSDYCTAFASIKKGA